ncbi:MAG: nucleotidyltransferase family protein [Mesorhizobium sp.]
MRSRRLAAICMRPEQSLADAIACIDASGGQIALVTDEVGRLRGTITDGDVRRGILGGATLASSASDVMNPSPRTARQGAPRWEVAGRLKREQIAQMPLINGDGIVVDILYADELGGVDANRHPVVIMAGGLGTRLRPITETIPKPMVPIAGRPILEIIVERFQQQGFRSITLCLNYLGEVIEEHFKDGAKFGVEISYIREEKRMGTAGALSLLSPRPALPVIVMNGDILTSVNFSQLLSFHYDNLALATMGLNRFQYQSPYGVVQVRNQNIVSLTEKPTYDFFVNAGIYVVSPEALDLVPADQYFDMPSLFDQISLDRRVAFPIHEYWLDIGRHADLERASWEFPKGHLVESGENQ